MRILILLSALLFGCQSETGGNPVIQEAWMSAAPPGAEVVAGYLTIDNPGPDPWTLTAVDSPNFDHIEVHTMSMEGGMMRMRPATDLAIPAGGTLKLAPGGAHLMMFGPKDIKAAPVPVRVTLTSADKTLAIDAELTAGHGMSH